MTEIDENIIELLDIETARINTPDFVEADPVQFPRRFDKLQDIEILLSAKDVNSLPTC